jgi:hypothetical protein
MVLITAEPRDAIVPGKKVDRTVIRVSLLFELDKNYVLADLA